MILPPKPPMPYWPAYSEPKRTELEQAYRAEEAKWQKEVNRQLNLNLILALLGPAFIMTLAFFLAVFANQI
jgi:hypothetical protein